MKKMFFLQKQFFFPERSPIQVLTELLLALTSLKKKTGLLAMYRIPLANNAAGTTYMYKVDL